MAGTRTLVHESIYDEFVSRIPGEVAKRTFGDPLDPTINYGPQISQAQLDKMVNYCDIGVKEGAKLLTGGNAQDRTGFFMEPTVFTDCRNDMRICQEEIFGPVMTV
jgi:acyl-CoA reductase-like NAD-dependent aldehyde dehydrogenase